jgi:hypothetical protein
MKKVVKSHDKKSFFRIVKQIIISSRTRIKFVKLIKKNTLNKNLSLFRINTLIFLMNRKKAHFQKKFNKINRLLSEKQEFISKLENREIKNESDYYTLFNKSQSLYEENEGLRKNITILESKIENSKMKFKELWDRNVEDIKNLQETLKNNEKLLAETIKREEKLQHKYCIDIENAIKLNKQLNMIICKKNKILAEVKIKQQRNDEEKINEQKKLYKENALLFNDYAKIIELKEKEKKQNEEEKVKILEQARVKIDELEEDKIKNEYKVKMLKKENQEIFNELITEFKNNHNY